MTTKIDILCPSVSVSFMYLPSLIVLLLVQISSSCLFTISAVDLDQLHLRTNVSFHFIYVDVGQLYKGVDI